MGIRDIFKKKNDFDDLLKEPVDGGWNTKSDDLGLGEGFGSEQSFGQGLKNNLNNVNQNDPLALGSNDVMGLPNQNSNLGLLNDSSMHSSFNNNDSAFNSNHTSASALGLNTNFPSQQPQSSNHFNNKAQQYNPYEQSNSNSHMQNNPMNDYESSPRSENLNERSIELIITKLDLIKSTLQHFDSRLSNIEQQLNDEHSRKRW